MAAMNIQKESERPKIISVVSGEKFGLEGYWVNKDQRHPVRILYELDPEKRVPSVTEKLEFIYAGKTKPSPLKISTLIADCCHKPK